MSVRAVCYWSIGLKGDGTTKSRTLSLLTAPFMLSGYTPIAGYGAQLSSSFSLSSLTPVAVGAIASDHGTVSASIALSNITIEHDTAIPDGEIANVSGTFLF